MPFRFELGLLAQSEDQPVSDRVRVGQPDRSSAKVEGEAVEQEMIDRPDGYVVLDFDQQGRLLGVEVIGARAQLRAETVNVLRRIDI